MVFGYVEKKHYLCSAVNGHSKRGLRMFEKGLLQTL